MQTFLSSFFLQREYGKNSPLELFMKFFGCGLINMKHSLLVRAHVTMCIALSFTS